MKKTTFAIGCVILLFICSAAYGAQGYYISGNLGYAALKDADMDYDYDDDLTSTLESNAGAAFTVAFGYDFGNNIRIEDEISYQKNDKDTERYYRNGEKFLDRDEDGETYSLSMLLNGYYDFANQSAFTPYICTGIGLSRVTAVYPYFDYNITTQKFVEKEIDDFVFAYQIGVGVGYSIRPTLTLDLKYRYFGTSDPKFSYEESGESMEYSSHNFYTGLRFSF